MIGETTASDDSKMAIRSSIKARKGAHPVPGPTRSKGTEGSGSLMFPCLIHTGMNVSPAMKRFYIQYDNPFLALSFYVFHVTKPGWNFKKIFSTYFM